MKKSVPTFGRLSWLQMTDRLSERSWGACIGILLLATMLSAVGCWNRPDPDTETVENNEKLAAQVKVALVQESKLNAAPIDIRVHDGVVTLEGFLENESQRQQAVQAAKSVTGVQSVVNNIQIKE